MSSAPLVKRQELGATKRGGLGTGQPISRKGSPQARQKAFRAVAQRTVVQMHSHLTILTGLLGLSWKAWRNNRNDRSSGWSSLRTPLTPPKVMSLTIGNCTVDEVAQLLRRYKDEIRAFKNDEKRTLFRLG